MLFSSPRNIISIDNKFCQFLTVNLSPWLMILNVISHALNEPSRWSEWSLWGGGTHFISYLFLTQCWHQYLQSICCHAQLRFICTKTLIFLSLCSVWFLVQLDIFFFLSSPAIDISGLVTELSLRSTSTILFQWIHKTEKYLSGASFTWKIQELITYRQWLNV